MIPTSTGAAAAISQVIPELEGKLDGLAVRVPTVDVSLVDLTVETEKSVSVDSINQAMKKAADSPEAKGYLYYTDEELVSSDFIGHPGSSIFDGTLTKAMTGNFAKVFSWYDNEWGFSNRMLDLVQLVAR
jgi:glyceraldehyde 3-phosphate dehydrogenase